MGCGTSDMSAQPVAHNPSATVYTQNQTPLTLDAGEQKRTAPAAAPQQQAPKKQQQQQQKKKNQNRKQQQKQKQQQQKKKKQAEEDEDEDEDEDEEEEGEDDDEEGEDEEKGEEEGEEEEEQEEGAEEEAPTQKQKQKQAPQKQQQAAKQANEPAGGGDGGQAKRFGHMYKSRLHRCKCRLIKSNYEGQVWGCDVCGKGAQGRGYHCEECNWDAHIKCFQPDAVQSDDGSAAKKKQTNATEEHVYGRHYSSDHHECKCQYLKNNYKGQQWGCDICGEDGEGPAYHCESCGWDAHPACWLKPPEDDEDAGDDEEENEEEAEEGDGEELDEEADEEQVEIEEEEPDEDDDEHWANEFDAAYDDDGDSEEVHEFPVNPKLVGKVFSSPMHEHALVYQACQYNAEQSDMAGVYECNICGKNAKGAVFTCVPCQFDAHPHCFVPQTEEDKTAAATIDPLNPLKHTHGKYYYPAPKQHQHRLQFLPTFFDREWICDVCEKDGGQDQPVYHCTKCENGFDVHPGCFKEWDAGEDGAFPVDEEEEAIAANPTRKSSVHGCVLRYMPYTTEDGGVYSCSVCNETKAGSLWSCEACEEYFCQKCFVDDGPGSETFNAALLSELADKPVKAQREAIDDMVDRLLEPIEDEAGVARQTYAGIAAAVVNYDYVHRGWDYPDLGRTAATVWNKMKPDVESTLCAPYAQKVGCVKADAKTGVLPVDLHVAVFFDLYRLQDWMVHDRVDTDMNGLVWSRILKCYAEGANWDELQSEGILVCTVEDMPRENSAFITHRWNDVQGVAAMSLSFFQCFVYHMAVRGGYEAKVTEMDGGEKGLEPLWIWCDYLSVPQRSWKSAQKWTADELAVRDWLNAKYIGFIGLQFGTLAAQVQFFINYVPMRVECEEDPTGLMAHHPLAQVATHLREFGMNPSFHLSARQQICTDAMQGAWGPLEINVPGWKAWQDQAYVQRIWCVAEYTNVWLRGSGERVNGCESWYRSFLPHIGGRKGKALLRAFKNSSEANPNHYLKIKLENAVMNGFAAWQKNVERTETTPKEIEIAKICQHILSFEGMLTSLAPAIATVVSDIPLVLDSFYGEVCRVGLGIEKVPHELIRMRNVILRLCHVGSTLPAIYDTGADGKPINPPSPLDDFLGMFVKDGVLHQYLRWIAQYMRLGANSLQWLDTLLSWRQLLQRKDAASLDSKIPFDVAVPCMPVSDIPVGYRFAKRAYTYLHRELGLSADEIPTYFCPLWSTRGWIGMMPLTKSTPMKFGKKDGVGVDYIEYITGTIDPAANLLDHFALIKSCPYRLLYKVESSYCNELKGQVAPSVNYDQACAIPKAHFQHKPFVELTEKNAHEAIRMGDRTMGIILSDYCWPTETIFPQRLKAVKGGQATPVWTIQNHVGQWAKNHIHIRTNVR